MVHRLALVTDAWLPQTNGVVQTLRRVVRHLETRGVEVLVIAPDAHRTIPLPSYTEIAVAVDPWKAAARLRSFAPDAVHVATEGPLGAWVRTSLARRGLRFTTSFHTRFPEYLTARAPIPLGWGYAYERWFHSAAQHTLVGTRSLMSELSDRRVGRRLVHWPRGVDTELFSPAKRRDHLFAGPRPIWLYVGRVAVEKSLDDFLKLRLPGTKVVVGDGPARQELQRRYPQAEWCGYRYGEELATHYASADCFVFPSRTETFGNVILEAMASGLPVAAVPAPGPLDLIEDGVNGALGHDLAAACPRAIACPPGGPQATAFRYTWAASHAQFMAHLVEMDPPGALTLPAVAS
jgi:glycosyltransferase involved in cell wall biosynthesis